MEAECTSRYLLDTYHMIAVWLGKPGWPGQRDFMENFLFIFCLKFPSIFSYC